MTAKVPLVDIEPFLRGDDKAKKAVALSVDKACRDVGFLVITGHGVSPTLRANIESKMSAFFELPPEAKAKSAFTPENPSGLQRTQCDGARQISWRGNSSRSDGTLFNRAI